MKIDIEKFCVKKDNFMEKEVYSKPFALDGYTYATNGYTCIRVPKIEKTEDSSDNEHIRIAKKLPWDHQDIKDWIPAPKFEFDKCSHCLGSGKTTICPECDGDGYLLFDSGRNEYEVDCQSCEETKLSDTYECHRCSGRGTTGPDGCGDKYIKIGKATVSGRILKTLTALPGLKLCGNKDPLAPILFIFDGGEGIFMPIRMSNDFKEREG